MRNPKISRPVRVLLAGAAAVATVLVPVGAASAKPVTTAGQFRAAGTTNCGSTVNGFDYYVTVRTKAVAGRTLYLKTGRVFDEDYSYVSGGKTTDRTWIDKRKVGSSSWTQCGPFNAYMSHEVSNPTGYQTRACFDYKSGSSRIASCTSWYSGHDGSS
ncbi:hypothetical protein KIH74_06275 [Kineosporia sp. J2-2]|uniref:Secreted protein n=1 Tax=Kineosporia corallincola TaxID=2835133 RepID=A0ABS5TEK3_9ACTN|nr:hypothetical protein [Kineosporia corallincola]MBT0768523.1 hypothetical protein [Kineosporia corallincola]